MLRILALLALMVATPVAAQVPDPVTVMSFNVRLPAESDGPNRWDARRERFIRAWKHIDADVVGTQELFKSQGDAIVAGDPRYAWFGRDRRGGHADEHMGIFYRKDRWKLLQSGDFWLSDTPDVPGSISWGHPLPRMVAWGRFERISDGKRFVLVNTHFPYRDEDEAAREKGAKAVAAFIRTLPKDVPVVLTGDFNTTPDSAAHQVLTAELTDVWTVESKRRGPDGTFHDFTGKADKRIDWILTRGFQVAGARTEYQREDGRYPSDHFPVVALLNWLPEKK